MKIPFQAMLAFAFLFFSGGLCDGTETLKLTVSTSPSTFTSVGEKITFTYKIVGEDYISFSSGYKVTNDVADEAPVCSKVSSREMSCTSTHTITTQDFALGYVTSNASALIHVGTYNIITFRPVDLTEKATTVVYIKNFVPSPTPTITATPVPTATPLQPGQSIVIPQPNILILQPVLAGSVSACDTGLGYINLPLADPMPDLTGKNLEVIINGYKVNCAIAGSRNQLLACSLPPDRTFPLNIGTTVDSVQVDSFSFSGATCTHTVPTKEKDPNDPNAPVVPIATPVDCIADPYNPACP
ncbi:MAG: hypothetical protein KF758_07390 [Anaerolineales bacterium]|nr:hypothetical protein [Anaerolineales bacterium]MBX3036721.1 hypothetical protein [Anaerolineales bacterium]